MRVRLRKAGAEDGWTVFRGHCGERRLRWRDVRTARASFVLLALEFPEPFFGWLGEGPLQIPAREPRCGSAAELFLHSTLGTLAWEIIHGDSPAAGGEPLLSRAVASGVPFPTEPILERLSLLHPSLAPTADQEDIDSALAACLDGYGPFCLLRSSAVSGRRPLPRRQAKADSLRQIAANVFIDGVPRFPEHYLYDHYRPDLQDYCFQGVLSPVEEFFGRVTLQDERGARLQADTADAARALVLASHTGRSSVSLPTDPQLLAQILNRYLSDVHRLRDNLLQQTRLFFADPREAMRMAEKIWQESSLPPWKLLAPHGRFET